MPFDQKDADTYQHLYLKNRGHSPDKDPIMFGLFLCKISPQAAVLEIGCGDGWRLQAISAKYKTSVVVGIDRSLIAYEPAKVLYPDVLISRGRAECLPFSDFEFDLVIFGYCLYMCDPSKLFVIASESDRVLKFGGLLTVHDKFYEAPASYNKDKTIYANYQNLWRGHPSYKLLHDLKYRLDRVTIFEKQNVPIN